MHNPAKKLIPKRTEVINRIVSKFKNGTKYRTLKRNPPTTSVVNG